MFKKVLILLFALCFVAEIYGQENETTPNRGMLGLTISGFGANGVVSKEELIGAASYSGDKFYRFGVNYIYRPKCDCIGLETGIEYAWHRILVNPNLPPNIDDTPYGKELSIISVPILFRAGFLKYFFFRGGVSIDIDASISSPINTQSGIGGSLGFGFEYDFKFGMSAVADISAKSHSLLPFAPTDNHQRLLESGIRLGLYYRLKR